MATDHDPKCFLCKTAIAKNFLEVYTPSGGFMTTYLLCDTCMDAMAQGIKALVEGSR